MKKKITISIGISALLITCMALAFSDNYQTNIRYLMWKWGWTDYSPETSMRYMTVDSSFQRSLKGLTAVEVTKWFPDLRVETKPDQYLDRSKPFFVDAPDFLWIGDTQWAIGFEDDKVTGLFLIKGWPKLEDRKDFQCVHSIATSPGDPVEAQAAQSDASRWKRKIICKDML